ncbi:MAG: TonB family protein [Terriglobales bacterium]
MPKSLAIDDEVAAYVAKTKGAIGYVSATATVEGVKIISLDQSDGKGARAVISRVEPAYPDLLHKNGIGGTVRVRVTIGANGVVEGVELLGGNPILGDAAMAAVKNWVFAEGRSRTTTEVSIPFAASR